MSSDESESRAQIPKDRKKSNKDKNLEELISSDDFSVDEDEFLPMSIKGTVQHSTIDTSKVDLWLLRAPLGLDISKLDGMKIAIDDEPSADGSVAHFQASKSQYLLAEEPLAHVKNVINLFPNSEDKRIEFGKPFTRNLKVSEVMQTKVSQSTEKIPTELSQKKQPELFVRFAPPGASLPTKIRLQKRSEVETGWKTPDAVPYVDETLRETVAAVKQRYEEETRPAKSVKSEPRTPSRSKEISGDSEKKKRKYSGAEDDEDTPKKKKSKKRD